MEMIYCVPYEDIEFVLESIDSYLRTGNTKFLEKAQIEIKNVKEIDYLIKTKSEYDRGVFIEASHGPARILMFYINYLGEILLDESTITIYEDDPNGINTKHNNTYILKLKDKETHFNLFNTNPTAESKPYDFDTEFKQQYTVYSDKITDTTLHPYDTFGINRSYRKPARTLDFKGAF